MVEFSNRGVGLTSLGHWANGVKEDGLTGIGFLKKDGFTGQDGQIENQQRLEVDEMVFLKWVKGN